MNYDIKDMLNFYDKVYSELVKATIDPKNNADVIKRTAKIELKKRYPESQFEHQRACDSKEANAFYKAMYKIQRKYNPVVKHMPIKPAKYVVPAEQKEFFERKPASVQFMKTLRKIAETGFIPPMETIRFFMNGNSPSNDTYWSEISDLRGEGYVCERLEYGYKVTCPPKETPEEKAKREAEEARQAEKAEIKRQIELLADRLNKLN